MNCFNGGMTFRERRRKTRPEKQGPRRYPFVGKEEGEEDVMLHVGCCGFPLRREVYYQAFSVVEVQQTFYQLPLTSTAERWREEAPSDFEFTMKAWQLITHEPSSPTYRRLRMTIPQEKRGEYGFFKDTTAVEKAWAETAAFAKALGARKIIFQCPASFEPTKENIDRLYRFFETRERSGFLFIWEPRGPWAIEEVERICRALSLVPCVDPFRYRPIEGPLLYARLHGRRGYRDTYSDGDLAELVKLARHYEESYLMFNNVAMYEDALRAKSLF